MAAPLRILHTNMLRGWGGQSNRILVECTGAKRAGHEVAIAAPEGAVLGQKCAPLGIDVWPGYRMRPPILLPIFFSDLARFRRDVARWKPDLIHLHGSQDTWLCVAAKRRVGAGFPPIIRSKHNIFKWRTSFPNRWLYPQIDAFVGISDFIERQIGEFPGIESKPRVGIHSVPDLTRFSGRCETTVRAEITALKPGMFLWGVSARLRPEKGLDNLLRAFALLRARRTDAHLVLAGDGSERAMLDALAVELKLGPDAVTFLGFRNDVPQVLSALDGYVLPSREEGLGTAILEALAVGLPVVATRVGGIPESVIHEKTGLLVEPDQPQQLADAMLRFMESEELRRTLPEGARHHIETNFTETALVHKTLSFYESVLKTCGHDRNSGTA